MNCRLKRLFLILLLIWPLCVQGKIFVVLVGISEYGPSYENLTYCHQDAIDMYGMLKAYTTPGRIILLTDKQAKHDSIVYYTKRLFSQAQPDDIVIFFFSGHGNANVFFAYDKSLYFNTLQSIFRQTRARRKLIFADACFSGTLRKPGNQTASANSNLGRQTASANANPGKNVLLFLSSRSDQFAQENSALKNGIFTYFLLAGLNGEADFNRDGYITAKELFNFVNPKVKAQSDGTQIPVMWGKFNENMVILKPK